MHFQDTPVKIGSLIPFPYTLACLFFCIARDPGLRLRHHPATVLFFALVLQYRVVCSCFDTQYTRRFDAAMEKGPRPVHNSNPEKKKREEDSLIRLAHVAPSARVAHCWVLGWAGLDLVYTVGDLEVGIVCCSGGSEGGEYVLDCLCPPLGSVSGRNIH